jgi:hypothetical protein
MPQGALYIIGGLSGGSTVKLLKKIIFHPFNLELDLVYLCWKIGER